MKKCSKCNTEKPKLEFYKNKGTKDGLYAFCTPCSIDASKQYSLNNKEKRLLYYKEYSLKNKHIRTEYYLKNKEKINARGKKWRLENIEYCKQQWDKNVDKRKIYLSANKERIREYNKKYFSRYLKERKKNDKLFHLQCLLRSRINHAFNATRWNKTGTAAMLIGCSFNDAKKHIENMFINGMSWDNIGVWHIDHIIPLSSAKTEQELINLCHYTNLQPLWAIDNLRKGSKK